MDDDSLNLIFGVIFLFLIVNTMFLWGIISSNNGQYSPKINGGEITVVPQIISAGSSANRFSVNAPNPVYRIPIQTLQPTVNNRGAALNDPPLTVTTTDPPSAAKKIASYLTIETVKQPEIEVRPDLSQESLNGISAILSRYIP